MKRLLAYVLAALIAAPAAADTLVENVRGVTLNARVLQGSSLAEMAKLFG
jgi:hypothetical protein